MNSDDKSLIGVILSWMGYLYGSITLNGLVLMMTLVCTVLQAYYLTKRIRRMDRERNTFF
jgi:hypothetical protein